MKKMKNIGTVQHGDVILRRVKSVPEGAKESSRDNLTLAHGESDHSHVINHPGAVLWKSADSMFLTLDEPATLTHEEHKAIQVPPGVWEVGRVKEYDYFQEMARNVQD